MDVEKMEKSSAGDNKILNPRVVKTSFAPSKDSRIKAPHWDP